VFVNKEGRPINAKKWFEHNWAEPLRKLQIRHRKFYATRHTFITEMVKAGRMIKAIGDYVGTPTTMIESNYAGVLSMEPDREIFGKSKKHNGEMLEIASERLVAGPGFEPGTSRL
jgi:integrase